ncbi:MAG: hypothetical protein AB7S44_02830 [Spirochaetales bacterium]
MTHYQKLLNTKVLLKTLPSKYAKIMADFIAIIPPEFKDQINQTGLTETKVTKSMCYKTTYFINRTKNYVEVVKTYSHNNSAKKLKLFYETNFFKPLIAKYEEIQDNQISLIKLEINSLNAEQIWMGLTSSIRCALIDNEKEKLLPGKEFVFERQVIFEAQDPDDFKFNGNVYCKEAENKVFTISHQKFKQIFGEEAIKSDEHEVN